VPKRGGWGGRGRGSGDVWFSEFRRKVEGGGKRESGSQYHKIQNKLASRLSLVRTRSFQILFFFSYQSFMFVSFIRVVLFFSCSHFFDIIFAFCKRASLLFFVHASFVEDLLFVFLLMEFFCMSFKSKLRRISKFNASGPCAPLQAFVCKHHRIF